MQDQNQSQRVFLSADDLDERANARSKEAERFPEGDARRHALRNADQLRSFAALKRTQATPDELALKPKQSG